MRARERDALLLSLKDAVDDLQPEGTVRITEVDGAVRYKQPNDTQSFMTGQSRRVVGSQPRPSVERVMSIAQHEAMGEEATQAESPELHVNKRAELLRHAEDIINGDRAQVYGPPEISFGRIAEIWNSMGLRLLVPTPELASMSSSRAFRADKLTATDVALVLIGMKLSRTVGAKDHEDNWLDLAGYAGLGAELAEREADGS